MQCKDSTIETIYLRVEGRNLGIASDKLYSALKSELIAYVKYDGEFIRHAELDLIQY